MFAREAEREDQLTNLMIRSRKPLMEGIVPDSKLNYKQIYDNPKNYQVSYVDALANLEEVKHLFKQTITDKNPEYNFFLDESSSNELREGLTIEELELYEPHVEKGEVFSYSRKSTWTKGKEFFFV